MRKHILWDDDVIARNTAINKVITLNDQEIEELSPLWNDTGAALVVPVTLQFNFAGGTLTATIAWSSDGTTFVSQAFAGDGDVSIIASATGVAWDNALIPALPTAVKVTITETNVAACTRLDAVLVI